MIRRVSSPLAAAATLGLVALLGLSGCATATPAAVETPVVETTEPSPTPTPTPTPTETVALADFGFNYFGAAQIGAADVATLEAQLGGPVGIEEICPWYPEVGKHGTYAQTYAYLDDADGVLFFYTTELGNDGDMPRNSEGVGVGSTEAEILAAYPDAVIDDAFEDISLGPLRRIIIEDPASDSKYVFAAPPGSDFYGLLQWGPQAGGQWAHLCLPL